MEIMIALVPMFAWGSIALVSGKMGGDANQQTLGMTMGAFLFSLVVFLVKMPQLSWWTLLIGLLSGIFWCIGQNGQFHGMQNMGVSVGLPLSTGMQLVLNTLAGAVFFKEWQVTRDYLLGGAALLLLILGAYLTARRDPDSHFSTAHLNFAKGFKALIFSTLGYGLYTIIVTWADLDPLAIILPQSIGMLGGALVLTHGKVRYNQFVWRNLSTGLLWGIGNIFLLIAIQTIGLAVSFSLSQMGIIISTLGGIFLLGEHKTKKELISVILGCLLVILGGILLGYLKVT